MCGKCVYYSVTIRLYIEKFCVTITKQGNKTLDHKFVKSFQRYLYFT